MENFDELIKLIKEKKLILFVGSGVPASIGMPTWLELIHFMCDGLDVSKDNYNSYGDFLQIASIYIHQKKSYKEIQDYIKSQTTLNRIKLYNSNIYKEIVALGINKVYTTNYDHLLEMSYHAYKRKHKTFRTIKDFADIDSEHQIIKFHGDVDFAKSFVLTEESYFERLDFNHPFDIKLRNDLIGNSILFIGYSLSDINIRYLLYKINKLWSDHDEVKPMKSYIFLSDSNPMKSILMSKYNIEIIKGNDNCLTLDLENFLIEVNKLIQM